MGLQSFFFAVKAENNTISAPLTSHGHIPDTIDLHGTF